MPTQENLDILLRYLGDCEVVKVIGKSRRGTIYQVKHPEYGVCGLKFLEGKFADNRQLFKKINRDSEVIKSLSHPNIGRLYDFSAQPFPYVLRELVQGKTLRAMLKTGPLPSLEATEIIVKLCWGMQACYNFGVDHLNLKPSNLFITPDQNVKIVDFSTPAFVPYYFSPEHCNSNPLDFRSDLYSIGVIYYHALTGQVPFTGASEEEVKQRHNENPYPTIPNLPSEISQVLDFTLAKKPENRYQDFMSLVEDLKVVKKMLSQQNKGQGKVAKDSVTFKLSDVEYERRSQESKQKNVLHLEKTMPLNVDGKKEESKSEVVTKDVPPGEEKVEEYDEQLITSLEDLEGLRLEGKEANEEVDDLPSPPSEIPAFARRCLELATSLNPLSRNGVVLSTLNFVVSKKTSELIQSYLRKNLRRECWLTKQIANGKVEFAIDLKEAKALRYFNAFDDKINACLADLPKITTIHKTIITRVEDFEPEEMLVEDEAVTSKDASAYSVIDTLMSITSEELPEIVEEAEEDSHITEEESEDWLTKHEGPVSEDEDWLGLGKSDKDQSLKKQLLEKKDQQNQEEKYIDITVNFNDPYQTRAWLKLVRENSLEQGKHFRPKPGHSKLRNLCFEINLSALQDYQRKRAGVSSVKEFFEGDYEISRLDHGGMATVLKFTTRDVTIIFIRPENHWAKEYFADYLQARRGKNGEECFYAEVPKNFEFVVKVAFEGREEALVYESRLLSMLAEDRKISKHIIGIVQQGTFLASTDSRVSHEKLGYYLMLEYASQGNVEQFSRRFPYRRLPASVALYIIWCMALTLTHLKEKGIIHRDIKPQNILISKDYVPKLGDFGLSITVEEANYQLSDERRRLLRLVDNEFLHISSEKEQTERKLQKVLDRLKQLDYSQDGIKEFESLSREVIDFKKQIHRLTEQEQARAEGLRERYRPMSAEEIALKGEFAGSLIYAAPEQFSPAKVLTVQCDVYQLGAVAYTMLTNKPPVTGKNIAAVMGQILIGDKPQVSDVVKNSVVVDAISDLIFTMMKNDPEQRITVEGIERQIKKILLKHFEELQQDLDYPLPDRITSPEKIKKWQEKVNYAQKVHRVCLERLQEIYEQASKQAQEEKNRGKEQQAEMIYLWWDEQSPPAQFRFKCPRCSKKLVMQANKAGKQIRCPNCQQRLVAKPYKN